MLRTVSTTSSTMPPPWLPSTTLPGDRDLPPDVGGGFELPGCEPLEGHASCVPGQVAELGRRVWAVLEAQAGWTGVSPWVVLAVWVCAWGVTWVWVGWLREQVKDTRAVERADARSEIKVAGDARRVRAVAVMGRWWPLACPVPHLAVGVWIAGSAVGFGWLVITVEAGVLFVRRWRRITTGG